MQLGESRGRDAPHATVWPDFVVVLPPDPDGRARLLQRLKPLLVQALVPELSIEALDVAILHGPPWLDQDVPDAMAVRPGHERPAGELGAVVCSYRQRIAVGGQPAVGTNAPAGQFRIDRNTQGTHSFEITGISRGRDHAELSYCVYISLGA